MMKSRKIIMLLSVISAVVLLIASGCDKKDSPAQNTTFNLMGKDVLGVTGKVTFTETSKTTTTVDIVLTNAPSGTHPANLYMNSVVENGAVVAPLNPVDATGKSSTLITTMSYNQMIAYAGSIKVFKGGSPEVVLAQGDIGGNVLTTTNKTYPLTAVGIFGVTGNALFEKRVNGNTLLTITLTGTIAGASYPATINLGSISSVGGGPVKKVLSNVNGTTGKSFTNIEKLDDGTTKITYDNWLVYDGYINIYQAPIALENVICNGNIGSN